MANYDEKKKQREKERQKLRKKQSGKANAAGAASYWFLAPLIIVFSIVPLVLQTYIYDTHLGGFNWYVSEDVQAEIFGHAKMVLLIITNIYMLILLLYKGFLAKEKLPWNRMMLLLFVYGALTIISALLSENSYFSFHGMTWHFESVWILLGYCLIAYYTYTVCQTEETIQKVMKWFVGGIAVMFVIGVMQGLGNDPLRYDWIQKLISIRDMSESGLEFSTGETQVYLTLSNSNNVAAYITLVMPLLFGLYMGVEKVWKKIVLAILMIAGVFTIYMSESKAGLLVLGVLVLFLLILYRKLFQKHWKIGIGILVFAIGIFVGINFYNKNVMVDRIKTAFTLNETVYALQSIETKADRVRITYNHEVIDFMQNKDENGSDIINVFDKNRKQIDAVFNEETHYYVIQDTRFPFQFGFVNSEEFRGFIVQIDGRQWAFSNQLKENDTSYYAYKDYKKAIKLKKDTTKYNTFLNKHQGLATKRGFIWSRSLPLLKKYFLLGSGPDTFFAVFPNDDMVAMANAGYDKNYISKPHSMYLQIAIQTGVPSLVCLLVFFGWYIIDSIRLYWKMELDGYLPKLGTTLVVSIVGFLLTGLTNDSFIGVTPVFCLLTGMGISINHILKKREKESKKHKN